MDSLSDCFDRFKISALSKSKIINSFVKNTTIGPNSTFIIDDNEEVNDNSETIEPNLSKVPSIMQSPVGTNGNLSIINRCIAEIENKRQGKVQEAINTHYSEILEFSQNQSLNSKLKLQNQQHLLCHQMQTQEFLILQALEEHDKDMLAKHQQVLQYYQELAEKRRKNNKELEEQEKRRQKINAIINDIKKNQVEFRQVYQEIINNFKNCKCQGELKKVLGDIPKQLKMLPDRMEEIVLRCKTEKISENHSQLSGELVQELRDILQIIQEKIQILNTPQQPEIPSQVIQPPQPIIKQQPVELSQPINKQPDPQATNLNSGMMNQFVSNSSLQTYSDLQIFLEKYTHAYNQLVQDVAWKQFRFDCKKAVNIPVNAISAISSHHLSDKYNRLSLLLSGKTVDVGNTRVNATKHPQGLPFCINLLAQKFALQGDLVISSNPEAAFCYATIIVSLWNENEEFGKVLLAHFHKQCPYLVPLYMPRSVGQDDVEFYTSQGYQYIDGVVERQDKFLKRMTGIMRLYAAILIAKPKRGQQRNPHGVAKGWRWLAAFLNLEPKPNITATMLHEFLEITGSALQQAYGKAFGKLMVYLCNVFLPSIQKIDSGGPVTRLEVLLQDYKKCGYFEPPRGLLPDNFW